MMKEDSEITGSILNSSNINVAAVSSNVSDVLGEDIFPDYLLQQNKSMKKSLFGDKGNNLRCSKAVQNPILFSNNVNNSIMRQDTLPSSEEHKNN